MSVENTVAIDTIAGSEGRNDTIDKDNGNN